MMEDQKENNDTRVLSSFVDIDTMMKSKEAFENTFISLNNSEYSIFEASRTYEDDYFSLD